MCICTMAYDTSKSSMYLPLYKLRQRYSMGSSGRSSGSGSDSEDDSDRGRSSSRGSCSSSSSSLNSRSTSSSKCREILLAEAAR